MITVVRIAFVNDLETLATEWTALIERAPSATVFHRPQWLIPWWRQFGSGDMHALAFYSDTRLVGFLGFFIHEWEGRRRATLIGTGITDYLGLVAEPDATAECARLALGYLHDHRDLWDLCDWPDLDADSQLMVAAATECSPAECCTRAELPSDADEFQASLPHGLRRTIRIAARRLEREGELRFDTMRNDPDAVLLRELFRLHASRWATKGGPGSMMDHPSTQAFLIQATRRLSALDKVRLYTMRYRGELSAIIYGMLDRGRLWGYITGMDPALSRFSPGSLVLDYAVREAIREGARAWEFLRGEEEYKFLWGAQRVSKARLRIEPAPATTSSNALEPTLPSIVFPQVPTVS